MSDFDGGVLLLTRDLSVTSLLDVLGEAGVEGTVYIHLLKGVAAWELKFGEAQEKGRWDLLSWYREAGEAVAAGLEERLGCPTYAYCWQNMSGSEWVSGPSDATIEWDVADHYGPVGDWPLRRLVRCLRRSPTPATSELGLFYEDTFEHDDEIFEVEIGASDADVLDLQQRLRGLPLADLEEPDLSILEAPEPEESVGAGSPGRISPTVALGLILLLVLVMALVAASLAPPAKPGY